MNSLQPAVLSGDYRRALKIAEAGLRDYPDAFVCRYQYAKLLGDYADELPLAKKKLLKRKAIRILRPLLRRLRGVPVLSRFGVCLNFYYQSEDFLGMYRFGVRFRRWDRQKSLYAQALAAGLIAAEFDQRGLVARSKLWAAKSVAAWKRYALAKDPYYFAHYSAAKSLALAGDGAGSMKELRRASVLAKRPVNDWEFQDVLAILKRAE